MPSVRRLAIFESGGGRVIAEEGVYLFGTVILRSNVEFQVKY